MWLLLPTAQYGSPDGMARFGFLAIKERPFSSKLMQAVSVELPSHRMGLFGGLAIMARYGILLNRSSGLGTSGNRRRSLRATRRTRGNLYQRDRLKPRWINSATFASASFRSPYRTLPLAGHFFITYLERNLKTKRYGETP
jgi:hypothetical protein